MGYNRLGFFHNMVFEWFFLALIFDILCMLQYIFVISVAYLENEIVSELLKMSYMGPDA